MLRLPLPDATRRPETGSARRPIRSYVRREGRLTPAQRQALTLCWSRYGLDVHAPFDAQTVFGRRAPLTLEIGCGDGVNLETLARRFPEEDFIGVDVYRPGLGALLRRLVPSPLTNLRLYAADIMDVLEAALPETCLDRVLIFFSDPWPKRRHHKRRLVAPPLLDHLARVLRNGGRIYLATDDAGYGAAMTASFAADSRFGQLVVRRNDPVALRVPTRFERRAQRRGVDVHDLQVTRIRSPVQG